MFPNSENSEEQLIIFLSLSLCCSSLPIKDSLVTVLLQSIQAVIKPDNKEMEMSEWTHRGANLQSKSFRILAHITGTEYSEVQPFFITKSEMEIGLNWKDWHVLDRLI